MRKRIILGILILILCYGFYTYMNYTMKRKIESVFVPFSMNEYGVPKVIYRTNRTLVVNENMYYYCHETWRKMNPDYSIIWYTDDMCNIFMEKMGDRVYNAYKKLIPGAYKADLWRACILYVHGGIYIDSFTIPYFNIEEMTKDAWNSFSVDQFIAVKDVVKSGDGIHNGFMIATPNHPFFSVYIEDMIKNIESNYYGFNKLCITGPVQLRKSINKCNNVSLNTSPKLEWNRYTYSFYLFEFVSSLQHDIRKNNKKIMSKKYSILNRIYELIVMYDTTYAIAWRNREVYKKE